MSARYMTGKRPGRAWPIWLCLFVLLLPPLALADQQALLERLRSSKQEFASISDTVNNHQARLETLRIQQNSSESTLKSLKATLEEERARLRDLRKAEEQFGNIDFTDQINQQRGLWQKANREYLTQEEYSKALAAKIIEAQRDYDIAARQQKAIQTSMDAISVELADAELSKRLRQIQQSKPIDVGVRETCSLSVTKDDCREQAKIKAERSASEKGSVVVVESVTEMRNFNMTKDEIRSRVKTRLSDIRVTRDTFDLTSDKSGWVVEYAISAMVTPVVTDQMISDLRSQIILGLASGNLPKTEPRAEPRVVNAPQRTSPQARVTDPTEEDLLKTQREMELAAQKARERDRLAAEQEALLLRQKAAERAQREARRQAEEENQIRRKVFPTF